MDPPGEALNGLCATGSKLADAESGHHSLRGDDRHRPPLLQQHERREGGHLEEEGGMRGVVSTVTLIAVGRVRVCTAESGMTRSIH